MPSLPAICCHSFKGIKSEMQKWLTLESSWSCVLSHNTVSTFEAYVMQKVLAQMSNNDILSHTITAPHCRLLCHIATSRAYTLPLGRRRVEAWEDNLVFRARDGPGAVLHSHSQEVQAVDSLLGFSSVSFSSSAHSSLPYPCLIRPKRGLYISHCCGLQCEILHWFYPRKKCTRPLVVPLCNSNPFPCLHTPLILPKR